MNTIQIIQYYANLLILQYLQKPKAYAMIQALVTPVIMPQTSTQEISFSGISASGAFELQYGLTSTSSINWNAPISTIQSDLRAISGLGSVAVSGSMASQSVVVTFTGVTAPAQLLTVPVNTLETSGSVIVQASVTETDVVLPIAVQNAYNLTGPSLAAGVQLDVIGKYTGVSRYGYGLQGQAIQLDDADFLSLIQFAILTNNAGSSLAVIQSLINQFFPGNLFVFDYRDMHMSYMIDSSIGTPNFAQMVVTSGLLPKPMGVQLATIVYAPDISHFFGFRTYLIDTANNTPFNSYTSYQTNRPWLSYKDAL